MSIIKKRAERAQENYNKKHGINEYYQEEGGEGAGKLQQTWYQ